jgi:hypothetical protein
VTTPLHPFRRWLRKNKLSYVQAAELCAKAGHPTSADYLKQIAIRWCRPGYDFASFLSEKLCKGDVAVEDFMRARLRERAA